MSNGNKEGFLKQLENDLKTTREAAAAWEELEKHNARLEDLNGKFIASATERKQSYRARERELLELIERVKTL